MATVTEKLHNGNTDAATTYSFPFQYIKLTDVKVEVLEGTPLAWESKIKDTDYEFPTATTVKFKDTKTPPAGTDNVRIYRETDSAKLTGSFYPNAAIRSQDLNENFNQGLFLSQETENDSNSALSNSRELNTTTGEWKTAISEAKTAVTTANTADTNATAAVSTANTASTNASNAVTTANTASTNASNAVTTANTASTNATSAVSTANDAETTANAAETKADTAISTANSATTTANAASTTATTADTNASAAVPTANAASATATAAETTANSAAASVSASAIYTVVTNVAALPALSSLSEDKFYQVNDSTLIQDESTVNGEPAGFIGDDELAVKLKSNISSTPKVWEWQEYYATDPETRYRKKLIVENLRTISEDYTIGTDNNGFSIGPVTISSGKTITIPANSKYVVMN